MSYNASDEKQVAKATKKAEFDKALRFDVIKSIMSTAPGRSWIYNWLYKCHVFHTPFIAGQQDATAFNCGEQNIGLFLLAEVQAAAPDLYLQMVTEAKTAS